MDNLTHTLVGVAMGEAGLRRRLGRGTTLLLAVSSNIPDLDVLISFTGVEDSHLLRRLFTHCVFGFPLLAAGLGLLWWKLRPEHGFRTWFLVALLGAGVHVFFDLVNSYGVVLLWPITDARLELAWVFIIDLVLWAVLIAPNALRLVARWRDWPARRLETAYKISLVLLAAWVGTCALGRWRATSLLDAAVAERAIDPEFTYVFPEPLGPHRWRGVAREGDTWHVWLLHSASGTAEHRETHHTAAEEPAVARIRESRRAQRLEWFYKAPVWTVDEAAGVARVFDLRFRSLVLDRGGAPFTETFPLDADPPSRAD